MGDSKEAEYGFKKAISIDKNFVPSLNNLGVLYHEQGRLDDAKDLYEKVIKVDSEHSKSWLNIGQIYFEKKSFKEATSCFEQVFKINPRSSKAYFYLGKVHSLSNNNELAIKLFKTSINEDSKNINAILSLAEIYYRMALEVDPNNLEGLNGRLFVLDKKEQTEQI
ncbi:tetratricopeptide repeat protein [Paraglaciecola sp.]|uniref:tetratricopeptide repeat protein n=1 Tax=Paraglaciecola sp. TaxID=1920173 RepID=UPI00273ED7A1|nr:tetratricopeptide repeat protein [Paraglaciecola sp.]MDP5033295.1 tetratricopeptide repeat protein [Paraglaciecola sp.]